MQSILELDSGNTTDYLSEESPAVYRIDEESLREIEKRLAIVGLTKDEKLEIKEFTTNTALSKDAEYLRVEKDKGILRWDLDLKPATVEEKATVITYGYTMKYDNDMHIQPISGRW